MKFNCSKCNKCCKLVKNRDSGIVLFEWEKNLLEQKAKLLGLDLYFEPIGIFKIGEIYLCYSWGVKFPCPFLKEDGCSIYESRPTMCKSFPINYIILNPETKGIEFEYSKNCDSIPQEMRDKLRGRSTVKEAFKLLINFFGQDLILDAYQHQYSAHKCLDILSSIGAEKKDPENIYLTDDEKENLVIKPLFSFCKKQGILKKEEIKKMVKDHIDCEDAKRILSGAKVIN